MRLTWHGQSCFTIEASGSTVVVDPYQDGMVPGHDPLALTADAVYCSHEHADHNARDKVALSGNESAISVQEIHTFHDNKQGRMRGENIIRIFSGDGMKAAHLGDLGCELEPEQKEQLKGLDAVMVLVGGFFTINAKQAKALVDELKPRIVIPMHYRASGRSFGILGSVDRFLRLCDNVVRYGGNTLEITKGLLSQTAVLKG